MTKVTLTPVQIENWRQALCVLIGPYALIMPPEMVQAWRDKMQDEVDKAGADKGEEDGEK